MNRIGHQTLLTKEAFRGGFDADCPDKMIILGENKIRALHGLQMSEQGWNKKGSEGSVGFVQLRNHMHML